MGIEKYFSAPKNVGRPKNAPLKRKPSALSEDDEDFQKPASNSKAKAVEKPADPKDFFSAKASTSKPAVPKTTKSATKQVSKATAVAENKPKSTVKSPGRAASKKRVIVISDDDEDEDDEYNEGDDDKEDEEEPEEVTSRAKRAKKAVSSEPKKTHAKRVLPTGRPAPQQESEIIKEAPVEKPKNPKANYFANLKNKEGPKALGSRPLPVGAENCLEGFTFVISGEFETLTREQSKDICLRYGGRVTSAVSGKTSYLLKGRDAGESKTAKARAVGCKILDEDGFYDLVESSAGKKPKLDTPAPKPKSVASAKAAINATTKVELVATATGTQTQLWTEKYKPTDIKDIIGNKETVRRISEWLCHWQELYNKGFEGNADEMNNCRALLLSGPPGIGKTTTASVVARANGYEALEFNASDVRSKKVLEQSVTEMMDNRTMTEFFQPSKGKKEEKGKLLKGKKVVLIMDEVDGMSGGDRGGSAEMAQLIRKSKIPVICICNDSRSTKVAPLLKVCFEAKFRRTPAAQIRSRILSIAFKEGLQLQPNAVDELISATQNDIRQVINILSTYRLKETGMNYDQAKTVGKNNQKYSILGLFDIPVELLNGGSWRSKTLTEKYEIYFHDYNLAHLMIYENYAKSSPEKARSSSGNPKETACNEMDLLAKAAESIADGDLVDSMIHGTVQHWSLMPVHSIFSCVRPANYMEGGLQTRIGFPSWLGQNSKAMKYGRQLGDVQTRMRLKASGDKFEIRQNYIPTLNDRIFGELEKENFEGAMEYMDTYYLDRENLETLNDLTFAPTGKGPLAQVPTRTKTAFTRMYNAKNHPILFQIGGEVIKKSVSGPKEDAEGTIIEEDKPIGDDLSEDEDSDKISSDPESDIKDTKYIKESTKATKQKRKTAASASRTTKKLKSKK